MLFENVWRGEERRELEHTRLKRKERVGIARVICLRIRGPKVEERRRVRGWEGIGRGRGWKGRLAVEHQLG